MNKTIKIIELLNLIANEEYDKLPRKIKYDNIVFEYDEIDRNYEHWTESACMPITLFNSYVQNITNYINEEAEIIEETPKKIEKINTFEHGGVKYAVNKYGKECYLTPEDMLLKDKINEIIDYIQKSDRNE